MRHTAGTERRSWLTSGSLGGLLHRAVLMTIEASGAATRRLGRSLDAFAEGREDMMHRITAPIGFGRLRLAY